MSFRLRATFAVAVALLGCGGGGTSDDGQGNTGGTPAVQADQGAAGAGGGAPPPGGTAHDTGDPTGGTPQDAFVAPPDAATGGTPDAATGGTPDAAAGGTQAPDQGPVGGSVAPDLGPVGGDPAPDAGPEPDVGPPPIVQDDSRLRINEFMASNHFTIEDALGDSSDWIELHNGGPEALDLGGYRVTNGFDEASRVTALPAGLTIAPGGYLLLWADGRSQLGAEHLRFALTSAGGSIGLARPDGTWLDRVEYGQQTPDLSSARTPDGSDQWQPLWEVSPSGPNPNGRGRPDREDDGVRNPDQAPSYEGAVERLFNGLPEFHLEIDEDDMQRLRDDPRVNVPATFTYNGRAIGPVGVRIKGQNSFLPIDQKPSLKIKIDYDDDGARFHGLKFLTLNNMRSDLSMVKEVLGYYMARTVGLFASRAGHALLYVNGEFYGVYTNLENIDSLFLSRWFADVTGPLYEGFDVDFRPEMVVRPCVDSEDPNRPGCFELESGEDDRTSLIGLANALTQPAPQAILDAEQFVSFDQFQLYWAVCANIGQFDSFPYSNPGDDYHLYVEPESGQITLIPWGMDETFLAGRNVAVVTSVLANRCLEDAHCHEGWVQQVWAVNDTMNAIDLAAELDARVAVIAEHVAMDLHKPYTNEQVAAEQARVRNFIVQRAAELQRQVPRP